METSPTLSMRSSGTSSAAPVGRSFTSPASSVASPASSIARSPGPLSPAVYKFFGGQPAAAAGRATVRLACLAAQQPPPAAAGPAVGDVSP
eukprot:CAMPEP_0175452300 /NCGR_PEP_ID=MMETSP0095-20121207/63340_1 /TAXON_ID=311494 /ORGANISM="Alexandrium monilatum, Strain CCMP3105" /LENGTH=90 /DNA_ID=CAMNT_0016752851 /DNA_START=15 /DNA_END=284 /DNA_ORIENTATION=-